MRDDIVTSSLNAPAPNNHYLTAGGRNGEFEDRIIANGFDRPRGRIREAA